MGSREQGFLPCALDTGAAAPQPRWERNLVCVALGIHIADITLDILVVLVFIAYGQWGFFMCSTGVILWAWLVSSLYVSFGGGAVGPGPGDVDADAAPSGRLPAFLLNFAQVQIFVEAYQCIRNHGDSDYFHTLRLMEAILQSAPNSVVQLYALVLWAGPAQGPPGVALLLQLSVLAAFLSVGCGLAMWEQKVQFRTSPAYVCSVCVLRSFEIASRSLTLALFAGALHPYGVWGAIFVDYAVMILLIARHQSVQIMYGFFVALPLVLVSLEPLVWRREDHAVPKDAYYAVRVVEFVLMWALIVRAKSFSEDPTAREDLSAGPAVGCEVLALLSTLGLFAMLPFVWRVARRHELSRDVTDWGEDGGRGEGLTEPYSDSEEGGGSGGSDELAEAPE